MEMRDMRNAELELLRRCVQGDQGAYADLVATVEKPLINFIYKYVGERYTAEDIFQETFVKVLRSIKSFKPNAMLTTWIFTIARNLCLDHIKAIKRHKQVSFEKGSKRDGNIIDFKKVLSSGAVSPDQELEKMQSTEKINEALGKLNPKEREILILRIYLDFPYAEISKIVGKPIGTVKYRVHQSLSKLGGILEEKNGLENSVGGVI